jgi:hypothetical protein
MSEITRNEFYNLLIDSREIFTGYGRYLQENGIKNDTIEDYENYLCNKDLTDSINIINNFVDRLNNKQYKVILYNGQTPILEDDTEIIDLIINDLNNKSIVEFNGDILTIYNEEEIINLIGYKNMSDGEIFARQYLDTCEYGDLIVKDSLDQIEFEDRNFKNIKKCDYYEKCKYITNIRIVPEDSEHYKMNWDCIIVGFGEEDFVEEIWQRV